MTRPRPAHVAAAAVALPLLLAWTATAFAASVLGGPIPAGGIAAGSFVPAKPLATWPGAASAAATRPPVLDGNFFPARDLDLASAGDLDGNGTTDWIRGEPNFGSGPLTGAGHVVVVLRLAAGGTSTTEIVGPGAFASFGASVAPAGDVNGDGYDDVIVGAPHYDNTRGAAYVFRGGPGGPASGLVWILEGLAIQDFHGYSVAGAGDVNGDGYDDVLVGAPGASTDAQFTDGRVSCYLGGPTGLSTTAAWTVDGTQSDERLGWSVAGNGDVNADGFADVLVGSPNWSNGEAAEGRVRLFLGGAGGLGLFDVFSFEPDAANGGADLQVAMPGDVNGDGFGDLVIGLPGADTGGTDDGRIYVFGGSAFPPFLPQLLTLFGGAANMAYGFDVAPAGDLNGDGFADFLASAPGFGTNGLWTENLGGSNFGATSDFVLRAGSKGLRAGFAMSGSGDAGNGDPTYLVGSQILFVGPDPAPEEAGIGLFVEEFPGETLPGLGFMLARPIAEAAVGEVEFGSALAFADVNGDGFDDVVAGGPQYEDVGSGQGRVTVHYGEPEGFSGAPPFLVDKGGASLDGFFAFQSPDWSFPGPHPGANFGYSVANAGDVNGDGYDDLLVGAPFATLGESNEGAAYLFLGGADGLALAPEWITQGNEVLALHGFGVGTAGDVNQDGYDDILVGAPLASPGGVSGAGRVSLYYGSPSGPAHVPARIFAGSAPGAHMGVACTGLGDVDNDGWPEVAISEVDYSNGEAFEGRVLAYRGGPGGVEALPFFDWEPDSENALAGIAVAPAGDVNGDGHADLLVGAHGWSNGEDGEGAVFVFTGSTSGLTAAPVVTLESNVAGAQFGFRTWTAGDLDRDGFGDVLVGSPGSPAKPVAPSGAALSTAGIIAGPPAGPGRCDVFFGTDLGPETQSGIEFDESSTTFPGSTGRSVAGGGDVNGDGWPDLAFGSPTANPGKLLAAGVVDIALGNLFENGLSRPHRALRSDNFTPIAHGLRSDLPTSFRIRGQARTPAGRGRVRLQWQAKAANVAFDGTAIGSSSFLRTSVPAGGEGSSIQLGGTVGGLVSGGRYRLRTRIASRHPYFQRSRWFTSARDGLLEVDLRTAGPTGFVAVDDPAAGPRSLAFAGPAPNPVVAGAGAMLRFALPAAGRVSIDVLDAAGRRVARVFEGEREAGASSVAWNARDSSGHALPPGLYFLRLAWGGEERVAKAVIAR